MAVNASLGGGHGAAAMLSPPSPSSSSHPPGDHELYALGGGGQGGHVHVIHTHVDANGYIVDDQGHVVGEMVEPMNPALAILLVYGTLVRD